MHSGQSIWLYFIGPPIHTGVLFLAPTSLLSSWRFIGFLTGVNWSATSRGLNSGYIFQTIVFTPIFDVFLIFALILEALFQKYFEMCGIVHWILDRFNSCWLCFLGFCVLAWRKTITNWRMFWLQSRAFINKNYL